MEKAAEVKAGLPAVPAGTPLADQIEGIERIKHLPKEVGVLLLVAGIGGLLLAGPGRHALRADGGRRALAQPLRADGAVLRAPMSQDAPSRRPPDQAVLERPRAPLSVPFLFRKQEYVMDHLSVYEFEQIHAIAAWKSEQPSVLGSLVGGLFGPLQAMGSSDGSSIDDRTGRRGPGDGGSRSRRAWRRLRGGPRSRTCASFASAR